MVFRVPVADTFLEMLDFLNFVNKYEVVLLRVKPSLNPSVKVVPDLNILECFFLLIYITIPG